MFLRARKNGCFGDRDVAGMGWPIHVPNVALNSHGYVKTPRQRGF
jgi:hypothetical protein